MHRQSFVNYKLEDLRTRIFFLQNITLFKKRVVYGVLFLLSYHTYRKLLLIDFISEIAFTGGDLLYRLVWRTRKRLSNSGGQLLQKRTLWLKVLV